MNAVPNQAMRTSLTLKTAAARDYITGSYSMAAKQYTEALHVLYDVGQHQQQDVQVVHIRIYHVCCIFLEWNFYRIFCCLSVQLFIDNLFVILVGFVYV